MANPIKNICLIYRPHSERSHRTATELAHWLAEKKLNVFTLSDLSSLPRTKKISASAKINLHLAIVLGGDGTFLRAVRFLQGKKVPILGVNLGNLGFLTETRVEELYEVVELALKKKMKRVLRSTILATVIRRSGKKESRIALNDVVLERGTNSRLIDMSIHSGKFLVSTVKADGLIIATPTGSTAYCLAAGGPIVHPDVKALTITPICPHTLTNRPIILSDSKVIRLKLSDHPGRAALHIDGQRYEDLTVEDELMITKSKFPVIMLSLPSRNYFDILRAKLRFGERK